MSPQQLRARSCRCGEIQPITARSEAAIAERNLRKKDVWYASQKEHWLGWLKEYDGPGYYGRQSWDVSAEAVYKRVLNPSMTLWLGEAAGVSKTVVELASEAALAGKPSMATQSGTIRRLIPWNLIMYQLQGL